MSRGLVVWCATVVASALAAAVDAQQLVYTLPGVDAVRVDRSLTYDASAGEVRRLDLYRPPETADPLPVVIFANSAGTGSRTADITVAWARLTAASGLAAVLYDGRTDTPTTAFDRLEAWLRAHASERGLDPTRLVIFSGSGNVGFGLRLAEDPARVNVRAAVVYYGVADLNRFRPDLPVLLVRAGVDNAAHDRKIDGLIAGALAANAPLTVINHPHGHHPFEEDHGDAYSRTIVAATLGFMHAAVDPGMRESLRGGQEEAAAAAALYRGDFAEGARLYAALAAARPEDPELPRRLADAYFGAKDYAKALEAYQRADALGNWREGEVAVGAARCAAQLRDVDTVLRWLARTPAMWDVRAITADHAFDPVRRDSRFVAFVDGRSRRQ